MIYSTIAEVSQFILYGCSATSLVLAFMIRTANKRVRDGMTNVKQPAPKRTRSARTKMDYRPVPVRSFVPMRTPDR